MRQVLRPNTCIVHSIKLKLEATPTQAISHARNCQLEAPAYLSQTKRSSFTKISPSSKYLASSLEAEFAQSSFNLKTIPLYAEATLAQPTFMLRQVTELTQPTFNLRQVRLSFELRQRIKHVRAIIFRLEAKSPVEETLRPCTQILAGGNCKH